MRKLCWCCAGAGVLVAGLFLAALQFPRHPDSFLSRYAVTASGITVLINPAGLIVPVAERVLQVWHPEGASEESVGREVEDDVIPDDPIPVSEPAGTDSVPQAPAGVTEAPRSLAAPEKPAARPAPIVIPEEGPEPMPAGLPAEAKEGAALETEHEGPAPPSTREMPGTQADTGAGEPTQESVAVPVQTTPPTMPYCVDEEVARRPMPHGADGGEEPAEPHAQEKIQEAWRFWKGLFWTDAASKSLPAPSMTPRACRPRPSVKDSGEEESEEPPPRTRSCKRHPFKDAEGEEECPTHPEVDTMEFRPSDAHLSDWGPGPF